MVEWEAVSWFIEAVDKRNGTVNLAPLWLMNISTTEKLQSLYLLEASLIRRFVNHYNLHPSVKSL